MLLARFYIARLGRWCLYGKERRDGYRPLWQFWFDTGKRARLLGLICFAQAVVIYSVFVWINAALWYPTETTGEALSNGAWRVMLGKVVTVETQIVETNRWCCTAIGTEMLFINTVPYKFGQRQSYTAFGMVSWVADIQIPLLDYIYKPIRVTGQIGVFQNKPQIILDTLDQIEVINDGSR